MNLILIFACDHRKNVNWNLPYIRLGHYLSDAVFNIKDDEEIAPFLMLLSEGALIWWLNKHYNEIGNPDYIGLFHYRRFMSFSILLPIINISQSLFNYLYCATPLQLYSFIINNKLDGLTFIPLSITNDNEHSFTNIINLFKFLNEKDGWNIPNNIIDIAFDLFISNCKNSLLKLSLYDSLTNRLTYVCNIFVLNKLLFNEFASLAFPVFIKIKSLISDNDLLNIHPRFMGLILERFTSLYLTAIQLLGKQIKTVPLITIDAHVHKKWDPNTKGDYA